jgi:hypothetical protein
MKILVKDTSLEIPANILKMLISQANTGELDPDAINFINDLKCQLDPGAHRITIIRPDSSRRISVLNVDNKQEQAQADEKDIHLHSFISQF